MNKSATKTDGRRTGATPRHLGTPAGTYLGPSKRGLLKVRVGGAPFLVEGAVHLVTGAGTSPGSVRWRKAAEYVTPNFDASAPGFEVQHKILRRKGSSDLVRIVGKFKALPDVSNGNPIGARPDEQHAQEMPAEDKPPETGGEIIEPAVPECPTSPQSKSRRQPRRLDDAADFIRQLDVVGAALRQGIDPDVGASFVTRHLSMSRATLYRRMASTEFPEGFVRNGRRRWLFSEIEKFRLGDYAGTQAAQSERAIEAEERHG